MVELKRFEAGASRGMRRFRLGILVAALSVLAVGVLYFVLGLSESPALRWRIDLSEVGRNSLDPSTVDLLDRLDEPVLAHVFFRRENTLRAPAYDAARERVMDLLLVASKLAPEDFKFQLHDLGDLAAANAEMQRLGVREVNTVVLEQADRHVILRLDPDFCELGPDPLDSRRFAVADFRGEEALVDGLLKVAAENRPKVLFTIGHRELDPESNEAEGLSALVQSLSGDGFDVGVWTLSESVALEEVDILAIIAPQDPFTEEELLLIDQFVQRGGRLLVALSPGQQSGAGTAARLLGTFGMKSAPGIVCLPTMSQDLGQLATGLPACAQFPVEMAGFNSSHPITKPIWAAARKLTLLRSRSFQRTVAPPGGTLQELLIQQSQHSWLDLAGKAGRYNYEWDFGQETSGPFSLAMAAEFPSDDSENTAESRVIGLGSASLAINHFVGTSSPNRDFIMNCFNWLAERDFNVRVSFNADERTMIDVVRGSEIRTLQRFAWYGLPGLLALIGIFLSWRRRT